MIECKYHNYYTSVLSTLLVSMHLYRKEKKNSAGELADRSQPMRMRMYADRQTWRPQSMRAKGRKQNPAASDLHAYAEHGVTRWSSIYMLFVLFVDHNVYYGPAIMGYIDICT